MNSQTGLANDLAQIALQEEQLQFEVFTPDIAWQLGMRLKEAVEARGKVAAIDIQLMSQPLFFFAMPGTTPENVDWIRRKRNLVNRYQRSSYAIGLELKRDNMTLKDRAGLNMRDYAAAGGCFPICLKGTDFVGTITISGLPQREDHNVVVAVLAGWLKVPVENISLIK